MEIVKVGAQKRRELVDTAKERELVGTSKKSEVMILFRRNQRREM